MRQATPCHGAGCRGVLALGVGALLLAVGVAAQTPGSEAPPDAGWPDAGVDACASLEARLVRRKAWLEARRHEQFLQGGVPDARKGIPNMTSLWCEAHADDEECFLGDVVLMVSPDEYAWDADASVEDYEPHVVLMKRAFQACRQKPAKR